MALEFAGLSGQALRFRETTHESNEMKPMAASVVIRILDMYAQSLRPNNSLSLRDRRDKQHSGLEMYRGLKAAGQLPTTSTGVTFFKKLNGDTPPPKSLRKRTRRALIRKIVATPQ